MVFEILDGNIDLNYQEVVKKRYQMMTEAVKAVIRDKQNR
jgi:hypothetical protein